MRTQNRSIVASFPTTPRHFVPLLTALTVLQSASNASSFQIGALCARKGEVKRVACDLSPRRHQVGNPWGTAGGSLNRREKILVFSSSNEDAEVEDSSPAPFFSSRLGDSVSDTRKSDTKSIAVDEAASGIAVADKEVEGAGSKSMQDPEEESEKEKLLSKAKALKAQADRVRLEAERMDAILTLERIEKLEEKLGGEPMKEDEELDARRQIDMLKQRLEAPKSSPKPATSEAPSSPPSHTELHEPPTASDGKSSTIIPLVPSPRKEERDPSLYEDIPPISPDELQEQLDTFLKLPKVLREMSAKSAGLKDDSNATAIVEQLYKDEQVRLKLLKQKRDVKGPMSKEKMEEAVQGYEMLPEPLQDVLAKSVGFDSGRNSTAVIAKLEAEGRLESEDGIDTFEIDSDMFEQWADTVEMNGFVSGLFPEVMRKSDETPTKEDVDVAFSEILGRDTFNPTSKPEPVPGGYIIRGENCMRDGNSDALVEALEKKLAGTSVSEKLQFYYIKDPTPVSNEEFMRDEYDLPLLLVTGTNLSPETNGLVKPLVSLLGLVAVGAFSLGCFSFNDVITDRLSAAVNAGDTDLTWLREVASPLFVSLVMTHVAHEAAHQLVALRDKIKVGFPTFVPSLQLGLTGAITPIKSPPKNFKSLFDFAMSGPLVGMTVSLILLFLGLEYTASADLATAEQFPSLPVALLRSSSLGGGMIELLLGNGILPSDPMAPTSLSSSGMLPLHPFAIAGFAGVITNALSLLPIGNTDGGRIAHTMFGRPFSRFVQGFTLFMLVVVGFFGLDNSNVLLMYALFATLWQREPEIACKNEVDELDVPRGLVAIGSAVLVALTLIPMTN